MAFEIDESHTSRGDLSLFLSIASKWLFRKIKQNKEVDKKAQTLAFNLGLGIVKATPSHTKEVRKQYFRRRIGVQYFMVVHIRRRSTVMAKV